MNQKHNTNNFYQIGIFDAANTLGYELDGIICIYLTKRLFIQLKILVEVRILSSFLHFYRNSDFVEGLVLFGFLQLVLFFLVLIYSKM